MKMTGKRLCRLTLAKQLAKQLAIGLWSFASVANAQQTVLPLKDTRARLTLPAYTPDERQAIADQSFLILDKLFVHRELKVQEFGAPFDPVPRVAALRDQAKTLDDTTLQNGISDIFRDLHDLHSTFSLPAPLSCGIAFMPLKFVGVRDAGVDKVVVASLLPFGAAYTADIKVGAELVSINGRSTAEVLSELDQMSGGANPDAMRFRAIQLLSMRALNAHRVPEEDSLRLHFVSPDGTTDVDMPWLTFLDEKCISGEAAPESLPLHRATLIAENDFQKRYNRLFGQPSLTRSMGAETRINNPFSDIFDFALLNTPAGQLGYVRIKSFYWNEPRIDVTTVVEAFRAAVETHLAPSRAIVVDVRGNPGGIITFAEKILQFFAPGSVQPTTVRMLANDLNRSIFLQANAGQENRWSTAVGDAVTAGQTYTNPIALTPEYEANDMGQIWFRPVVVLTDAGCYSACDLFSAGMQDNNAALILGTHETTGAGGANVMDYGTFKTIMAGAATNPFRDLPHRQNMRISWRQLVRAGANDGSLIEGRGIKSDVVVPLTSEDIQSESKQLMRQIHEAIKNLEPRYASSIQSPPRGFIRLANASKGRWTEKVVGIDRLVVKSQDQIIFESPVAFSSSPTEVVVEAPSLTASWRDQLVTVQGWREGRQVFGVGRTLAWRGEYLALESGHTLDFEGDVAPLHTYMIQGDASQGWQTQDGKLRVGNKPTYDGGVHARALLPLSLEGKSAKISFAIAHKSEELYDSFRLFAINPDTGAYVSYFAGYEVSEQTASFELPKDWQRADVIFEFESDENWHLAGPRIDDVKIEPMP